MLLRGALLRGAAARVPTGSAGVARRALSGAAPLQHTALHDLHLELGGKMVPFAGYSLPVQYPKGVLAEHHWTRAADSASLFDVGHMGQLRWYGADRVAFLEHVCCADVAGLAPGASTLTLLTLPHGGILDDSIISNHGDYQCVGAEGGGGARARVRASAAASRGGGWHRFTSLFCYWHRGIGCSL